MMDIGVTLTRSITSMERGNDNDLDLHLRTDHHLSENDFDSFMASSATAYTAEVTAQNQNRNLGDGSGISPDMSVVGMEQASLFFKMVTESKRSMRKNPAVTILGLFCSEGDNRPDGSKLAFSALSLLCPKYAVDKEHSMLHPASWNVLYGSSICEDSLSMIY